MRRFFMGTMVAIAALMPTWAAASEQEAAQQIADGIRQSGKLKDYSIGVKFENGTAYLMGRVANEDQARTAMELAKTMPNVSQVVNDLEIKPSAKKDYDVEPTSGSSRRTMNRDEMVFGASAPSAAPAVEPIAAPAELPAAEVAARPHLHHHARRSAGGGTPAYSVSHGNSGAPIPVGVPASSNMQRVAYDQPNMPCYAWPSYAASPNYAAVTYPQQYSAAAWPYIGPFYPYPQVPLGWRRVSLEWDDGWWWLDFNDHCKHFRR